MGLINEGQKKDKVIRLLKLKDYFIGDHDCPSLPEGTKKFQFRIYLTKKDKVPFNKKGFTTRTEICPHCGLTVNYKFVNGGKAK